METASKSEPVQQSVLCISLPQSEQKINLGMVDNLFPRTASLISNRLDKSVATASHYIASVTVNSGDNYMTFRNIRPRMYTLASSTKNCLHLSSRGDRCSNSTDHHLKKRKRAQGRNHSADPCSSSPANDHVVTDDDDSIYIGPNCVNPKKNKKKRRMKGTPTNSILGPPPPTPLPLQLNTSQIHSKKYPFPHKLFDLLKTASADCQSSKVVSWLSDGTAFVVHNHARFAAEFLPTYFGHTQLRSFDRQLNYWGFELISPRTINNTSFGGKSWKHPFFQKDRRNLLKAVTRKIGGSSSSSPSSSPKVSSFKKMKKSRPVKPTIDNTRSQLVTSHPSINTTDNDSNDDIAAMERAISARVHLPKTQKHLSLGLASQRRMVSPFNDDSSLITSGARNFYNPSLDTMSRVSDKEAWDANGRIGDETDSIVDDFWLLFPFEFLNENKNEDEIKERAHAKSVSTISFQNVFVDSRSVLRGTRDNGDETSPQADLFEGNSFHQIDIDIDLGDIDMDEDMSIGMGDNVDMHENMNIDDSELFLNIEDLSDNDCFLPL